MNGVQSAAVQAGRIAAFVLLGIVLPALLLLQAYQAMGRMSDSSADGYDVGSVLRSLPPSVQQMKNNNDYALVSIAMMEASNQRTMLVKQRMKMSVMHIGFAVISLGLMLLVLGLEAGGVDLSTGATQAIAVNLKTTSTAVTAVLLGAAMAAAGALMPNPYTTVSVPSYAPLATTTDSDDRLSRLHFHAVQCVTEATKESLAACFQNSIVAATSNRR